MILTCLLLIVLPSAFALSILYERNSVSKIATITLTLTGTNDQPILHAVTASDVLESNLNGVLSNEFITDVEIEGSSLEKNEIRNLEGDAGNLANHGQDPHQWQGSVNQDATGQLLRQVWS